MSVIYVSALEAGKACLALIRGTVPIDHVVTIDAALAAEARVSGHVDFGGMGVPTHHVTRYSMQSAEDRDLVRALAPDLLIVNGWNRLIPRAILALPRCGAGGFHGSAEPLPAGRGRSPVTWALVSGATQFFLHLFHLDEGADSGDIIATARFDIMPADTCATPGSSAPTASSWYGTSPCDGVLKAPPVVYTGVAGRRRARTGRPS